MPTIQTDMEACVFDAYGTLFDVAAAARRCQADLGDNAAPLAQIWRTKQLEYTWLRSLMGAYVDFWQITGDGLDFALETLGIDNPALRERLMQLYRELDAYPEVPDVLKQLKAAGLKLAVLSNGSPDMLNAAVSHAGLDGLLDASLSVDDLGIYKPHPSVYQLAVDRLGVSAPSKIAFMSSNAWDAAGAATYGFRVNWVNRFGQKRERLPDGPENELNDLRQLPSILGVRTS
ncbi:MAG: haloacid dehalogenase type II [Rhodospirillales bacterium]